jgi:hypothetical protein
VLSAGSELEAAVSVGWLAMMCGKDWLAVAVDMFDCRLVAASEGMRYEGAESRAPLCPPPLLLRFTSTSPLLLLLLLRCDHAGYRCLFIDAVLFFRTVLVRLSSCFGPSVQQGGISAVTLVA